MRYRYKRSRWPLNPIILLMISIIVIGIGVGSLYSWLYRSGTANQPPTIQKSAAVPTVDPTAITPLLFGSNLKASWDGHEPLSPAFRVALQRLHIHILRIAPSNNEQALRQLLVGLKDLGVIPLLTLHSNLSADALDMDIRLVKLVQTIFAKDLVYYELGSEEDTLGVTAENYSAAWNKVIPRLKQLMPGARFLGPSNFHYDQQYLSTFLQQAKPRPDAVSWHEYTCDRTWNAKDCIAHIASWTDHVNAANTTMKTLLNSQIPIMITEWNYASNATIDDGKSADAQFMQTWMNLGLRTLANAHVFAAMQFAVKDTAAPLVTSDNRLTVQGVTFQQFYERSITEEPTPTVGITPISTPTPTLAPTFRPIPTSRPIPTPTPIPYKPVAYEAEDALLTGGAQIHTDCPACSGGKDVGYIGKGGVIVFHVTVSYAGAHNMTIYYTTPETRPARISINGGAAISPVFTTTGSWSILGNKTITINLVKGDNTIMFYNDQDYCPNLDRIVV